MTSGLGICTGNLLKNSEVGIFLSWGFIGFCGFTKFVEFIPNNVDSISIGLLESVCRGIRFGIIPIVGIEC
jgi:hypothetical protein